MGVGVGEGVGDGVGLGVGVGSGFVGVLTLAENGVPWGETASQ